MKKIIIIFFLFLIISCDEEDRIIDITESQTLDTLIGDFQIEYSIYPEYSFWGHTFYIKLQKTQDLSNDFKFYFDGMELTPKIILDSINTLTYYLETPLLSNSNQIEIRNYISENEYLLSKTKKYEIVNSEIQIEEVISNECDNLITVKGKGLKYAKYLKSIYQDAINAPFDLNEYYSNNEQYTSNNVLTSINDSTATFNYKNGSSFGIRIEAPDYLKYSDDVGSTQKNIFHHYKYLYKSNSHFYLQNPSFLNYTITNNNVKLNFNDLIKTNNLNIKFGNKLISSENISLIPSELIWNNNKLEVTNSEISFQIPDDYENNTLEINFNCEYDTNFRISYPIYQSISISSLLEITDYEIIKEANSGYDTSKIIINTNELKIKSDYNFYEHINTKTSDNNGVFDGIYDKFYLYQLNDNFIDFKYQYIKHSSSSGFIMGRYADTLIVSYSGYCDLTESGDQYIVSLTKNELVNSLVTRVIKMSATGSAVAEFDGYLKNIFYTDESYFRIVIKK